MISLYLLNHDPGSPFIETSLRELDSTINIQFINDLSEIPNTEDLKISLGPSFSQEAPILSKRDTAYHALSFDSPSSLSERKIKGPHLIHIDLRIVDPKRASAVECHQEEGFPYLSWESLMIEILGRKDKKGITHFHLSGFSPMVDRNILLKLKKGIQTHHLQNTQETLLFLIGLIQNCAEVLNENL